VPEETALGGISPEKQLPDFEVPQDLYQVARDSNEVQKHE